MGRLEYWSEDQILFVNNLANTKFDSIEVIDAAFAEIDRFWKKRCGKKVYCIIDYTNLTIEPGLLPYWSEKRTAAVKMYSVTAVRFGADLGTRVALRAMAIKTPVASNVYATREEAIAVVRGISQGTIQVAHAG